MEYTFKDAQDYILQNFFDGDDDASALVECEYEDEEILAMKRASEAIEKQIEKKPKHVAETIKREYSDEVTYDTRNIDVCPVCGNRFYKRIVVSEYCGNCGTKIDWSEENG